MSEPFKHDKHLAELLLHALWKTEAQRDPLRRKLREVLREGYAELSKASRDRLVPKQGRDDKELLRPLLSLAGTVGLHRWARANAPAALASLGSAGTLRHWLKHGTPAVAHNDDLEAGLRAGLGIATDQDKKLIDARLGQELRRRTMATPPYKLDPRGLPPGLSTSERIKFSDAVIKLVTDELKATVPAVTDAMTSFVIGALSLDGFLQQDAASQLRHIRDLRFESEQTTVYLDGVEHKSRDAYVKVDDALRAIRGSGDPGYFEELAFVARQLLRNSGEVPIDASGLGQRVIVALAEYEAPDAGGNLSLPSLSGPEANEVDLVRNNIRSVGLIYAAWNLEEVKLFQVLDRVIEVFMNGQLPVGYDNGGRALSEYYFDDDDKRLTEAARRMTYSRVLGVPGGEVSREAPPNAAFQNLFMRFIATTAEQQRQMRIDDVIGRARIDVLSNTDEQVRSAGFELAANASLYGYGGTFFVAQRLAKQIERALQILSIPEILAAYGVQSAFQVIERVCASDLGGVVPNVVQRRTMAEGGKAILDLVAKYVSIWRGSPNPLFFDPVLLDQSPGGPFVTPDIPREDQERLVRSVDQWLAVNGIKDAQRAQLGEPQAAAAMPSIPTVGGDGSGGGAFDQIRQMVSAGQTPSIDQLKAMLPGGANGALRV